MAVDPNELLIFKLRGTAAASKEAAKSQPTKPATPQQQAQPQPQVQPQPQPQQQVQPQSRPQVQPQPQPQQQVQWRQYQQQMQSKPQIQKPQPVAETQAKKEKSVVNLSEIPNPAPAEETNFPLLTPELGQMQQQKKKKFTKIEEESIEAAKGMMCINHPWRPAYAICNYCKRPFCYADLVEYNGAFYCLEDIDKVTGPGASISPTRFNSFTAISSVFFLANATILGYFIYPQALFLIKYINNVGFVNFLNSLTYSYGISFINLILVVLGLFAGLILYAKNKKWFYISWAIDAFILIIVSYEYLTLNSSYLLAISVLAFINIGTLAYSRLSASTEVVSEIKEEVNWPKVEIF